MIQNLLKLILVDRHMTASPLSMSYMDMYVLEIFT